MVQKSTYNDTLEIHKHTQKVEGTGRLLLYSEVLKPSAIGLLYQRTPDICLAILWKQMWLYLMIHSQILGIKLTAFHMLGKL